MHADAPRPARHTAPADRAQPAPNHAGYDTRHEHVELALLGGALLTIVTVVLVSISTLLG